MKACPSRFWEIAFQCLGMLHGIGPNTTQPTALQHLTNYSATTHASPSLRHVTIHPNWSLLEFLMEPLFYNPNIPGRWGARHEDPHEILTTARQRGHATIVTILRISTERRQSAHHIYNISLKMAKMRCTRFANLLIGTGPGERMHFTTYRRYCKKVRHHRIDPPNKRNQLHLLC
jgi:hypothetical protein